MMIHEYLSTLVVISLMKTSFDRLTKTIPSPLVYITNLILKALSTVPVDSGLSSYGRGIK